jgi:quercetin dioxygenase-like cupin family protein
MEQVLNPADFASARAVRSAKLKELGLASVCMEPGAENPGHSHTLVEEILIVRQGTGKIQIEDKTYDLCPGSVAVVPAGRFHAVCNTGSENLEGVTIFNTNVDREAVVLKNREEHFGQSRPGDDLLCAEIESLKKANKKLKKAVKKLKKRR